MRRLVYRRRPEALRAQEIGEWIDESVDGLRAFGLRPVVVTRHGVFVKTLCGPLVFFDPRRAEARLWSLETTGEWEPDVTQLVRNLLERKGGVFIDVGANVGYFSLLVALGDCERPVLAFEPIPAVFEILRRNWEINGRPENLCLTQMAVGEREQQVMMHPAGQLSHRVVAPDRDADLTVPMTSLDHWVSDHGIEDVAVIKCDVEGGECEVLAGATRMLDKARPHLVVEVDCRWLSRAGRSVPELISLVRSHRYECHGVDGRADVQSDRCANCGASHIPSGNYWFCPTEQVRESVQLPGV